MPEERLKLAVFIDFDNIQIGVKDTLNREFDVSTVLEALKERGEVVAKVAYGDWSRAGDQSRQMTQHAIQMVQRSVTPRGDKNGADINLALDALEMAFTRHHINAFAIVGGDSDFMALVEKLKQFDKQVFVIGGRAFTSNILQKNCTEFIAYENLLRSESGRGRSSRRGEAATRPSQELRALSESLPNIQRALKILADRGVAPQLGLLKSTLLQLDSTFTERDYGTGSFLEFMQKVEREGFARLRRTERGYLVELAESIAESKAAPQPAAESEIEAVESPASAETSVDGEVAAAVAADPAALEILRQALISAVEKAPGRPLYLRQVRQRLRAIEHDFDERKYGYRGTLDLLHCAQRDGWLKMQRDHKGIWRIYPLLTSSATPETLTAEAEPGGGEEQAATPEEFAFAPESAGLVESDGKSAQSGAPGAIEIGGALSEQAAEPVKDAAVETDPATPGRKARKPRPARPGATKGTRRKAPSRKKPAHEPEA
ncbi:MAG: NYN domain-containing protein [Candidatus Acidiferrales bacterium]